MTTVLLEPFDNLTAWGGGGASLITGPTGICVTKNTITTSTYAIAGGSQSDYAVIGARWQTASLSAVRPVFRLGGDSNATIHSTVRVNTDGSLSVMRGSESGTVLATSAAGLVTAGTWCFIELKVRLHDTAGSYEVRFNGSTVIGPTGSADTKNAGTGTVYDGITLNTPSGVAQSWDDLYLLTGSGETFRGDQALGTGPNAVLDEPFANLTAWPIGTGTASIVTGRHGTGMQLAASATRDYTIPSGSESYYLIVGFAVQWATAIPTSGSLIQFRSDAAATLHDEVVHSGGTLLFKGAGGITRITTASLGLTAGTWYYFEFQLLMHDTAGSMGLRLAGSSLGTNSNVDNRNAGTKTTVDTIRLVNGSASNVAVFDDLYIRTGTLSTYLGDTTVPAPGINVNVFNGAAFVTAPLKVWSGSAFVDPVAVKTWNGSAFV